MYFHVFATEINTLLSFSIYSFTRIVTVVKSYLYECRKDNSWLTLETTMCNEQSGIILKWQNLTTDAVNF
jgi:hypothetical protein